MTTLLPVATARALIATDLDDTQLGAVIAREEAMLIRKLGPHGDGTSSVTETIDGYGGDLYLPRPVVSVTSVDGTAWASLGATLYASQGRICGGSWGAVAVVYVPADDRDERQQALIDLVRLAIQRTAMKAESVAGEYSYSAPESWEAARASIYRRLMFTSV